MAQAQLGQPARDFSLATLDGQSVTLSHGRGRPCLLVFLRHLGWLPCRDHVAQLRRFKDEFERLDAQVLLISFGEERWARAWLQETAAPFPLLLDPERAVYRAYGLDTSFVRVWSPKVMWHYTRRVLAGQKLQSIQGDPHQLGGDFVVDAQGVIRLAHRSRDPVDRPPVETLLAALM